MITFYGYAVKKDGKYLGYNPKRNERDKLYKKQFYKRPIFPVVDGKKAAQEETNGYLGEVVKVKLTMEEVAKMKRLEELGTSPAPWFITKRGEIYSQADRGTARLFEGGG